MAHTTNASTPFTRQTVQSGCPVLIAEALASPQSLVGRSVSIIGQCVHYCGQSDILTLADANGRQLTVSSALIHAADQPHFAPGDTVRVIGEVEATTNTSTDTYSHTMMTDVDQTNGSTNTDASHDHDGRPPCPIITVTVVARLILPVPELDLHLYHRVLSVRRKFERETGVEAAFSAAYQV